MSIRVEFYGLARHRAGVAHLDVETSHNALPLGAVLAAIGQRLPDFARECLPEGRLCPTLSANLNGDRFLSDPATPIPDGACLLIVSADAGG